MENYDSMELLAKTTELLQKKETIIEENVKYACDWTIGWYFDYFKEGTYDLIPDTFEEVKDEIFWLAMAKCTGNGIFAGKAPIERQQEDIKNIKKIIEMKCCFNFKLERIAQKKDWKDFKSIEDFVLPPLPGFPPGYKPKDSIIETADKRNNSAYER